MDKMPEGVPFIGPELRPGALPESAGVAAHDPALGPEQLRQRALGLLGPELAGRCPQPAASAAAERWGQVYQAGGEVAWTAMEEEIILLAMESSDYYSLNRVGAALWRLLDGQRTLEQVAGALLERYEASESALRRDVLRLVAELERQGLIRRVG